MKQSIAVLLLSLVFNWVAAQEAKFGKVSEEELAQTSYPEDATAPAAVLHREQKIGFEYNQDQGFKLVTHVYERVKIYKQEGFEYATVSERLYKDGSSKENLSGLKAYTYNWENGKVAKYKLEKSGQFTTQINKYYDEEKFTMPNVREGSVIEYEYSLNSPFFWSVDELVLQYDIPIQFQEVSFAAPEYYVFKSLMKGYLQLDPKNSTTNGKINFMSKSRETNGWSTSTTMNNSSVDYRINKTTYVMKNVAALKEEPYVNNMDNYRSAVSYELQYVQFPNSAPKDYTSTWEKVIEHINKSDGFGDQLNSSRFFKDDLSALLEGKTSDSEKTMAIFAHVQQRMAWNGIYGIYADKGVKTAYKEKSGNIADINLMLVSMLREAGIKAHPVIISTRDNGVPLFPTAKGFNYVIAAVELKGQQVFLDATNKFTEANILQLNALNWSGKLIKEDGSFSTVSVLPEMLSRENVSCNVNLGTSGEVSGKLRKTYTDYNAYRFRNRYVDISNDSYLENLERRNKGMEVSAYNVNNKNTLNESVMEDYEFTLEDQVQVVGDKMYFSPLLHNASLENPFKLEQRNYPIDFSYPWEEKYAYNIVLPEGYAVEEIPADLNMVLPNKAGTFLFKIAVTGQMMQVMATLKMNQAIIPATDYADVKEFYKKVVEKEAEKVVLSKITSNGTTNGTTDGR